MTTIDKYARARQVVLAREISERKKVYLDTCFWIALRDAALRGARAVELLNKLKTGVANGTLICPISQSTFIEVMKQSYTPERRIGTAALIDELSLGVSLIDSETRTATEIAHFIYQRLGQHDLYAMQELVWTKGGYTLGYLHPMLDDVDEDIQLQVQEAFLDEMWEQTFSGIAASIGADTAPLKDNLKESAEQINRDIHYHSSTLISYEQTYMDEVIGALDVCGDVAVDIMGEMALRAGHVPLKPETAEWNECRIMGRNILRVSFLKSLAQETVRTIHALASLHAGLRWQRRTNFTDHHYYDFDHAAAAVAYCDAFFTEGFLSNLINANHIRLDQLNGCETTDELERAISIIQNWSPKGK
jgi:hypothetical protein